MGNRRSSVFQRQLTLDEIEMISIWKGHRITTVKLWERGGNSPPFVKVDQNGGG